MLHSVTLLRESPRLLLALLLGAAIALSLAACTTAAGADRQTDVVLVVAPTTGTAALTAAELDAPLSTLDSAGDRLVAVVADGAPFVAIDVTVAELPGNSKDREEALAVLRSDARTAILAKTAQTPEVDLTEAIALAAESFRGDAEHTLTVFSSGLQTTGALSLLDGRLYAEPADLIAHVEQSSGIPSLSDVTVRMPKLGIVVNPQPALTEGARTALTGIWGAYFARAGATGVDLAPTSLLAAAPPVDLPSVTPVPIDRPAGAQASGCRSLLAAASIGFAAGSAEFADPAAAQALLTQAHADLAGCPGDYTIEGSASSEGDAAANEALSRARAESAAAALSAISGVPVSDMHITGWGVAWPCRVADLDAHGDLILDAATANRVVVVSRGEPHC